MIGVDVNAVGDGFASVHEYLLCGRRFIGDAGWVITGALIWSQR